MNQLAELRIERVDYRNPQQGEHLLMLLDNYARDPMGGGEPISDRVRRDLLPLLKVTPQAVSFIAYLGAEAVGLLNAFETVSTFAARPLINIHDLAVQPSVRGQGVGRRLIEALAEHARSRNCCKLTLEVLTGNHSAIGLYENLGFEGYALDPAMGSGIFMQKKL
ncbi:GNAT family N-acetyltransferase [Simiduia aestuariiviva]|uniref:GNAT superfamily N-acetyltransferase n=1 Tax=Simiduia aestuariiviva TaxID=1510459 RepID=A0A839UHZ5_9GAMM|nr:GNAT family N-acetyltransferase [Simiduia aestuariiviva]MBB3167113.1 GNAT superfamily N-acetyltransferase [Simiduia aestuariiviva]